MSEELCFNLFRINQKQLLHKLVSVTSLSAQTVSRKTIVIDCKKWGVISFFFLSWSQKSHDINSSTQASSKGCHKHHLC